MGQIKKCPTCGTENAASEAFCGNCSGMIASVALSNAETAPVVSQPEQKPTIAVNGITCPDPSCGHLNPPGQDRCILCNTALAPPVAIKTDHKSLENKAAVKQERLSPPAPAPAGIMVIPYRTGGREFVSLHEIALYFAGNWDAGMEQIDDNYIHKWADSNFPYAVDVDSLEFIKQLTANRKRDHDVRLTQFITKFAPELPPIWKGIQLTPEVLVKMLKQGVDGDAAQKAKMIEIIDRSILDAVVEVRFESDLQWCINAAFEALTSYHRGWFLITESGGETGTMPSPSEAGPAIMLTAISEDYRERMRGDVIREYGKAAKNCSWYAALGKPESADAGTLVVLSCVGPRALEIAKANRAANRKKLFKLSLIPIVITLLVVGFSKLPKNISGDQLMLADKAGKMRSSQLAQASVVAESANVRSEASSKARIVARLSKGAVVSVVKTNGDWVKCRLSENKKVTEGWVHKSILTMK
jgi:hypothetical protein